MKRDEITKGWPVRRGSVINQGDHEPTRQEDAPVAPGHGFESIWKSGGRSASGLSSRPCSVAATVSGPNSILELLSRHMESRGALTEDTGSAAHAAVGGERQAVLGEGLGELGGVDVTPQPAHGVVADQRSANDGPTEADEAAARRAVSNARARRSSDMGYARVKTRKVIGGLIENVGRIYDALG